MSNQPDTSQLIDPNNSQRIQDEVNSIKRHLQAISRQTISLSNDYNPPYDQRHRRPNLPVITLASPPSPVTSTTDLTSSTEPISIILKSLKPALSFQLSCSPTSTIAELKQQAARSNSQAPPPGSQRWLYKGKALADNKLLKEYPNIMSNETVHLMISKPKMANSSTADDSLPTPSSTIAEAGTPMATSRSSSPLSHSNQPKLAMSIPKITMDAEGDQLTEAPFISRSRSGSVNTNPLYSPHLGISESFRSVVTKDGFWVDLKKFLDDQFGPYGPGEDNARQMWEHCFNSSKEWMTASEIARIREAAGISGMAGR
ncbi:hypothetical protein BY996DRAFT_6845343 [Phakopsora pachyrhizi]|uniref:Ubiquitin-like domain-containing protein n=1 Tax=Phakopsora pachyrhizi TaxID=170000 RepID=A0AAV0B096_PHAPC|nr:hypothetical protein BY996DRAFT_6845343 [Phakopsora pachyrhizi]CAH7675257.1 hypothetical protein PPACK8108_LOCUS10243 [Phakopsora pachyrhizi]